MSKRTKRSRADRDRLKRARVNWPKTLAPLPVESWPDISTMRKAPREVWRSLGYIVQVFAESDGIERLTVCRTVIDGDGEWQADIEWEVLQRLKKECGRGDRVAVEVYPRDADVVNVANMRHLWVLPDDARPDFGWRTLGGARDRR